MNTITLTASGTKANFKYSYAVFHFASFEVAEVLKIRHQKFLRILFDALDDVELDYVGLQLDETVEPFSEQISYLLSEREMFLVLGKFSPEQQQNFMYWVDELENTANSRKSRECR